MYAYGFVADSLSAEDAQATDSAIQRSLSEAARYEEKPRLDISDDRIIAERDKRDLLATTALAGEILSFSRKTMYDDMVKSTIVQLYSYYA